MIQTILLPPSSCQISPLHSVYEDLAVLTLQKEAARSCSYLFINTVYTLEDMNQHQHSCENLVSNKDKAQYLQM